MCLFLGGSLSFTLGSSCFILEQTNIFSNGSKAVQLSALYHVIGNIKSDRVDASRSDVVGWSDP